MPITPGLGKSCGHCPILLRTETCLSGIARSFTAQALRTAISLISRLMTEAILKLTFTPCSLFSLWFTVERKSWPTLEGRKGLSIYPKSLSDDVWIYPDLSLKNSTKVTWLRYFYVFTEIQCSNPGNLTMANGNVSTSDPEYFYGATLLFECNEGYELRGRDTITCFENGWTPRRAPYCISE